MQHIQHNDSVILNQHIRTEVAVINLEETVNQEEKQLKINWVSGLSSLAVHYNSSKQ